MRRLLQASRLPEVEIVLRPIIGLVAVSWLSAVACSPADPDEPGTPIDMAHPPHIRAGLWDVSSVIDGRLAIHSQICDGGRWLGSRENPPCAPWQAKTIKDNVILETDSCVDNGKTSRIKRYVSGDLQSRFAVRDFFSTETSPLTRDRSSDEVTYRYLGACPAGMHVKQGAF